MPSPVRTKSPKSHGEPHSLLVGWLVFYKAFTPGVFVSDNSTLRLDTVNEPQPDITLRIGEIAGGQAILSSDDLEGGPELLVEVAATTQRRKIFMAAIKDRLVISTEIPPLEHGDHLTRDEFEQCYEAMPEIKKAELIEGMVS